MSVRAQTSAVSSTATQAAPQQPHAAATAIPSYPDSPAGLERLIKDMLKMQKDGDSKNLSAYTQSLVLPNAAAWFTATFGDEMGRELADSYDRTQTELPLSFPDILSQLRAKHFTDPKAVRFSDSCDPAASEQEYQVLQHRTSPQPLYDVHFFHGAMGGLLHYFAYVNGAFRYIGSFALNPKSNVAVQKPSQNQSQNEETAKVPGNVMAAKAIHLAPPVYPFEAKEHGVQGTVILHAIIGANGAVCSLRVIQGPDILAQAAMNAVSRWRYTPTTLNGQPVAVDTTITVVFQLGQ